MRRGAPRLLWVLMVTSAVNRGWPDDVVVPELDEAGLPAASVVRAAKIATINAPDAERVGCLPVAGRVQVVAGLRSGLADVLERVA